MADIDDRLRRRKVAISNRYMLAAIEYPRAFNIEFPILTRASNCA